jgi:anti-anti-sigma factor
MPAELETFHLVLGTLLQRDSVREKNVRIRRGSASLKKVLPLAGTERRTVAEDHPFGIGLFQAKPTGFQLNAGVSETFFRQESSRSVELDGRSGGLQMMVASVSVITPEGRLTSVMNPCSTACALMNQSPAATLRVLLDLRAVKFLDASGVAFIAALYRAARGRGGELRLVGVDGSVRSLLEMSGLLRIIRIFETEEAALASFVCPGGPEVFLERAKVFQHPGGFRWAGSAH